MVGGLKSFTLTRPDMTFAVNQVFQFMHAPRQAHLQAVKRSDTKRTICDGFFYPNNSYADGAGDPLLLCV